MKHLLIEDTGEGYHVRLDGKWGDHLTADEALAVAAAALIRGECPPWLRSSIEHERNAAGRAFSMASSLREQRGLGRLDSEVVNEALDRCFGEVEVKAGGEPAATGEAA